MTSEGAAVRVTKVKFYKKRVTVDRVIPNLGTEELVSLVNCPDNPRDQFQNAFVALMPLALSLAGIRDKHWVGDAVVSQVAIGRDGKGRRNFVLTVIRPLEHGVITFNTPVRLERFEDETGPQYALDELTKTIDRVCAEALVYANGERTQLALDLDAEEPGDAAEERHLAGAGVD